ncbi:MAG: hypothetical protein ACRC57_12535 [Sarcina sp.]
MIIKIKDTIDFIKKYLPIVAITICFYAIYYLVLHNKDDIITSIMDNLISVPFNVLVTGILFDYILNRKTRKIEEEKIDMVIGIFYTEVGNDLLKMMVKADECIEMVRDDLLVTYDWNEENYENAIKTLDEMDYCVDIDKIDVNEMKLFLDKSTPLIIDLLSGNVLKNKIDFTEIVVSVFHLRCECNERMSGSELEQYEKEHLIDDIEVAYKLLAKKWYQYMYILQNEHPQLFVKALINSPFDNRNYKIRDYEILKLVKERKLLKKEAIL